MPVEARDASANLIAGRKPVLEVLKRAPELVRLIYLQDGIRLDQELQQQIAQCSSVVEKLPPEEFELRFPDAGHHQGVVAIIFSREKTSLESLVAYARAGRGLLVVLEEIQDPQNLGSLFRACAGAAVDGVVVTSRRSAPLSPVVSRASVGASELLPVCQAGNLQQQLRKLKNAGFWIVGAALGSEAKNLFQTEIPRPCAVVFGSEGKGLRELTRKECDLLIEIPMHGVVQSLNVGQAAAVVLFEFLRQHDLVLE